MSGGVDSSVAALLCKESGYDCIGVTMQQLDIPGGEADGARAICDKLGIPFYSLDLKREFKCAVINDFIKSYELGETPNPCVVCNKKLKFGALLDFAAEKGCEYIATGHYARIEERDGSVYLKKAVDPSKDQSYMLWALGREQLSHVMFPLGELTKAEVREIARKNGFENSEKKDSQDICFVPDGDYAGVIERYSEKTYPTGNFVLRDGTVIGGHKGIVRYTIGQRRGLGLSLPEPLYVCEKRIDTNEVVLCRDEELFSDTLTARDVNLINGIPGDTFKCTAKIRYNQKEQGATVRLLDGAHARVTFDEPQRAIAKGQSLVLYDGDTILGGGIIE